jgi:acyl-CoA thioester hydrolase
MATMAGKSWQIRFTWRRALTCTNPPTTGYDMTTHATHPHRLVHTSRQSIRWGDMDMLGHVNNTVYFRYCEQARIEWTYAYAHSGVGYDAGQGPVVVNASCNFRIPLTYPGEIDVKMYLANPGRTSVDSHYELWQGDTLHADGAAKIVWIDLATGRPVPLPAALVEPLRIAER